MKIISQWLLLTTVNPIVHGRGKIYSPSVGQFFKKNLCFTNTMILKLSEGCVKNLMKLEHARGELWCHCLWLSLKETLKSGYILNNFRVYVQNHIRKPMKWQKYNIVSIESNKYFSRNLSILLWSLGSLRRSTTRFSPTRKKLLTSAKNRPFWMVAI